MSTVVMIPVPVFAALTDTPGIKAPVASETVPQSRITGLRECETGQQRKHHRDVESQLHMFLRGLRLDIRAVDSITLELIRQRFNIGII